MPNWCANTLKMSGDELEIKRAMKMLKDDKGQLTFNKAVPMPLPLVDAVSPSKEPNQELIKRYGADNWYDWRYKHWGVKWDASESEFIEDNMVVFQTPWNAPIKFLERFSQEFPSLTFGLQFADENEGYYPLGEISVRNGVTEDVGLGVEEGSMKAEEMAATIWQGVWYEQ